MKTSKEKVIADLFLAVAFIFLALCIYGLTRRLDDAEARIAQLEAK